MDQYASASHGHHFVENCGAIKSKILDVIRYCSEYLCVGLTLFTVIDSVEPILGQKFISVETCPAIVNGSKDKDQPWRWQKRKVMRHGPMWDFDRLLRAFQLLIL